MLHESLLVPLVRRAGYQVLDPWRLTPAPKLERVRHLRDYRRRREAWRRLNAEIGETNRRAIERADAVIAVLDGSDVDSGTAAEIGFAFARGKPIVGYRGDFRRIGDNDGATVNLQVEYFIRASGGTIVDRIGDIRTALGRVLARRRPREASRGFPTSSARS